MNWKRLRKNIPKEFQVGPKYKFKVTWTDDLPKSKNGRPLYGMTEFNPNTIKLRINQSDESAVLTFFHEVFHTLDVYKNNNLTEKQVMKIEKRFLAFYMLFRTLQRLPKRKRNAKKRT